jgi:hypothetical protein
MDGIPTARFAGVAARLASPLHCRKPLQFGGVVVWSTTACRFSLNLIRFLAMLQHAGGVAYIL